MENEKIPALIVVNAKMRKPDGSPQPIKYLNATYSRQGDWLVIECDMAEGRGLAKVPIEHVIEIQERGNE